MDLVHLLSQGSLPLPLSHPLTLHLIAVPTYSITMCHTTLQDESILLTHMYNLLPSLPLTGAQITESIILPQLLFQKLMQIEFKNPYQ